MFQTLRSHKRLLTITVLLGGALLALHAWVGTPYGHSYKHNLPWFDAFRTALWSGDLYPRFLPDLWFGFGGADFYFYGPLPFWFASIVGTISCPGCNTGQAFSVAGAWLLILSGVSFFVFARSFFDRNWSGIGAMIYMLLPYHYLVDWFARQSIGEVAVYVFLPLVALATHRLLTQGRGGRLLAISIAATLLSHLPSALIVAHVLPVIVVWHALRSEFSRSTFTACLLRFGAWGGLGVAIAAIYWIPAISLLSSVSPSALYNDYFDAKNWLFLDGRPEPNPSVSILAKWSLALAVTACLSALYLMRRNAENLALRDWILLPCVLTAFLTTSFSALIWDVWILDKIQFPWRFLVITDLSIALAAIVILQRVFNGARPKIDAIIAAGFSGLMLCAAVVSLAPQWMGAAIEGQSQNGAFRISGAPEYIPEGVLKNAFVELNATASDKASDADRYVIFFDVMEKQYERAQDAMNSDTESVVLRPLTQGRYQLSVELTQAGTVRVPIAYWRFWRAKDADGGAILVELDLDDGLIKLSLPEGRSEVQIYLVQTLPEKIGSAMSLIALLVFFTSLLRVRRPNMPVNEKPFATSLM